MIFVLFQIRECRKHDHPGFNQSLQLRQTSGGEGGDRVCSLSRWQICLQAGQKSNVRVHDQLHPQTQEPAGEIHDEQRS